MSSGEERTEESAAAPRNFNCLLTPPPSLHEGGHSSRALSDPQEQTAETLCDGDALTFQGQAK